MKGKFLKFTFVLALGSTVASCGEPGPLQAQDFLNELDRHNITHFQIVREFELDEYSTSPVLIEVCLEEFNSRGRCNGVGFYVNQFDFEHADWEFARDIVIELSGGFQRVRANRNLLLTNFIRHLTDSEEMRRILTIFENFG